MRFRAPSGWPSPPEGWVPDAGWAPDPSWPPPPQGWSFWESDAGQPAPAPAGLYPGGSRRSGPSWRLAGGSAFAALLVGVALGASGGTPSDAAASGLGQPSGSATPVSTVTVTRTGPEAAAETVTSTTTVTAPPTTATATATTTLRVAAPAVTRTLRIQLPPVTRTVRVASTPVPFVGDGGEDVYYANCTAARAAGVTPIRRGQPGYRSGLDRDDDGVACE